jgi:hypothetical protein
MSTGVTGRLHERAHAPLPPALPAGSHNADQQQRPRIQSVDEESSAQTIERLRIERDAASHAASDAASQVAMAARIGQQLVQDHGALAEKNEELDSALGEADERVARLEQELQEQVCMEHTRCFSYCALSVLLRSCTVFRDIAWQK